ncbi:methyl-accepting chemotaxis protein [Virgibacillus kekensis]|uniref:Methyl-accepting chemotaxis protein n=1 Tax=Virgibacillus kekensis TaxID=202261 RepID=A0ABV9DJ65_9BACI
MGKKQSLRRQFILRMFIILLSITVITGIIQVYYLNKQVSENVEREASMIGNSIEQGIVETDMAARAIERQIDYKLEVITNQISEQLPDSVDAITTEQLIQLRDQTNIAGIDIFSYDEENIVSVTKSTEPDEIGFTLKGVNDAYYATFVEILEGNIPDLQDQVSYQNGNTLVFYTAQSGSREEPKFFKYGYQKEPGTDYFISTFIEANEVNQFTQEVGPESWIDKVSSEHEYAKEIAVLDPKVFADPSLAEKMYPPLQKVIYGQYSLKTDEEILIGMVENPEKVTRIDSHDGEKIYKMFMPLEDGRVIYVAMDYEKMIAPFKKYSLILIAFGIASLVVLFIAAARFFNKIYNNIAQIIAQIISHEKGDFTVRSDVHDKGELGQLSTTANKMADTLNHVLSETREQAVKTERHAYLLESEANNSVEKVYSMSMEATADSRDSMDEINHIINQIEELLQNDNAKDQDIRAKIADIHALIQKNSNTTTEMTITLSDVLKSLQGQSTSLSDISKKLLKNLEQFELDEKQESKKVL